MAVQASNRQRGPDTMVRPPSLSSSLIAPVKKPGTADPTSPASCRLPGVDKAPQNMMMQRSASGSDVAGGMAGRFPPATPPAGMTRRLGLGGSCSQSSGSLATDGPSSPISPMSPFAAGRKKSIGESCLQSLFKNQQQAHKESDSSLPTMPPNARQGSKTQEPTSPGISPMSSSKCSSFAFQGEGERRNSLNQPTSFQRRDQRAVTYGVLENTRKSMTWDSLPDFRKQYKSSTSESLPDPRNKNLTDWSRQSSTDTSLPPPAMFNWSRQSTSEDINFDPENVLATLSGPATGWSEILSASTKDTQTTSFTEEEVDWMQQAFDQFADADSEEVGKTEIVELLKYLGYFGVAEDRVTLIMTKISDFSTLSFEEFLEFVKKFKACEQVWLHQAFMEFTCKKGELDFFDLASLLRSIGVVGPRYVVHNALSSAGLEGKVVLQWEDILKFVAAYRTTGHFTSKEREKALEAYKEALEDGADENDCLKTSAIMDGVLKYYGLHAIDAAKRLFENVQQDDGDCEKSRSVDFNEFLVWVRLLRENLYDGYWKLFSNVAKRNVVSNTDLQGLLVELGYSVSRQAVAEFLESAKLTSPLDFDGFVSFVNKCHEQDGFRRAEVFEFKEVFNQFDYEQDGEIQGMGVIDMLRYLGYSVTTAKANEMMRRVDYNDNGSMDVGEFMRLMRLQTEQEMMRIRAAFSSVCSTRRNSNGGEPKQREIPLNDLQRLKSAITSVGMEEPTEDDLNEILMSLAWPSSLDLDGFTSVVNAYRKVNISRHRQRANFDGEELRILKACFQKHTRSKAKVDLERSFVSLQKVDLMSVLADLDAPRIQSIGCLLQEARTNAKDSGVDGCNLGEGESRITLWDALHLLRGILRSCECANIKRETDAVEETKFTVLEMNELRSLFEKYHEDATVPSRMGQTLTRRTSATVLSVAAPEVSRNPARRKSVPAALGTTAAAAAAAAAADAAACESDEVVPYDLIKRKFTPVHMKVEGLFAMLKDLGCSVQVCDKVTFFQALECLNNEGDAAKQGNASKEAGFGGVQFPDFLRLMRWMIINDFAGINDKAPKALRKTAARQKAKQHWSRAWEQMGMGEK